METKLLLDPYVDCCCDDCAEYGAEVEGECEVFNAAVATLPQGFGEGINVGPCTSKCKAFRPSDELLRDMEDAAAYSRESAARLAAMGRRAAA